MARGDDDDRDGDREPGAPGEVSDLHRVVGRQHGEVEALLVQAGPPGDARPDERARARRDESRQQRVADDPRRHHAALRDHLEEQEGGDERLRRAPRSRRTRLRARAGGSRRVHADEADGERAEADAQRHERRLGPEHEPRAEREEGGEEDAAEVDRADVTEAQALERSVPAVARKAAGERDEGAADGRHEQHVPACGLAPAEPVGDTVPDEMMSSCVAVWKSTAANATGTPSRPA